MKKMIDFKYEKEKFSFLNQNFTLGTMIFVVILILLGVFISDIFLMLEILGVISIGYIIVGIKTLFIVREKNYFKKNGKKCEGLIKGIRIDDNYNYSNTDFDIVDDVCLVIEYTNPYTNCLARFVTEPIHGNPYSHLKSLKVTVYVLEEGKAYATNFKKIKRKKDAIKYHDKSLIDIKEDEV